MSFVVRVRVCNDANSGADRLVQVTPGDFGASLRPGEECVVIAVGLHVIPSLTVVESEDFGTHIISEGEAAIHIEGPRRSETETR